MHFCDCGDDGIRPTLCRQRAVRCDEIASVQHVCIGNPHPRLFELSQCFWTSPHSSFFVRKKSRTGEHNRCQTNRTDDLSRFACLSHQGLQARVGPQVVARTIAANEKHRIKQADIDTVNGCHGSRSTAHHAFQPTCASGSHRDRNTRRLEQLTGHKQLFVLKPRRGYHHQSLLAHKFHGNAYTENFRFLKGSKDNIRMKWRAKTHKNPGCKNMPIFQDVM